MNEMAAVRGAVDGLVAGSLGPLLDLLAEGVAFEVASAGDVPGCRKQWGRRAVTHYFTALGGLVGFWRMDYSQRAGRVIAWGDERFTLQGSELEGGTEVALVLDFRDGLVTRFLVIEDLSCIPGWDFASAEAPGGTTGPTLDIGDGSAGQEAAASPRPGTRRIAVAV
jgi:hypothetical protein